MQPQPGRASRAKERLPDTKAHECHAERQPAEQSYGDNRFEGHRRIGSLIGRMLRGFHVVAPVRAVDGGFQSRSF